MHSIRVRKHSRFINQVIIKLYGNISKFDFMRDNSWVEIYDFDRFLNRFEVVSRLLKCCIFADYTFQIALILHFKICTICTVRNLRVRLKLIFNIWVTNSKNCIKSIKIHPIKI